MHFGAITRNIIQVVLKLKGYFLLCFCQKSSVGLLENVYALQFTLSSTSFINYNMLQRDSLILQMWTMGLSTWPHLRDIPQLATVICQLRLKVRNPRRRPTRCFRNRLSFCNLEKFCPLRQETMTMKKRLELPLALAVLDKPRALEANLVAKLCLNVISKAKVKLLARTTTNLTSLKTRPNGKPGALS